MNKWLPTIIAAALAGLTSVAPDLQHVVSSHPSIATAFALAYAVLSHLMPSPLAPKQ